MLTVHFMRCRFGNIKAMESVKGITVAPTTSTFWNKFICHEGVLSKPCSA